MLLRGPQLLFVMAYTAHDPCHAISSTDQRNTILAHKAAQEGEDTSSSSRPFSNTQVGLQNRHWKERAHGGETVRPVSLTQIAQQPRGLGLRWRLTRLS